MLLFESLVLSSESPVFHLATSDFRLQFSGLKSLLLSSLFFNYFFQYVKERFVSLQFLVRSVQLKTAHCKLPSANWHGGE
jgi:hypothetical protein